MDIKAVLHARCAAFIEDRLHSLQKALQAATESLNSETKSTAGDKHETGRAMAQLEQEQLSQQWQEAQALQNAFNKLPTKTGDTAQAGSLLISSKGNFYLSIAVGKIDLEGKSYYAISTASPLGKLFLGKKKGEKIGFNGQEHEILEIL